MKKQKVIISGFILALFFTAGAFAENVLANGSATVSWVSPTTNEDLSTPVDLVGYRVFYSTSSLDAKCTAWDAETDQTARKATSLFTVTHADVTEANTLRDSGDATKRGYTFSTGSLLTPGQTYNFTVVAYDSSGNYSKCINDSGSNKTASKLIYYSGNLKNSGVINISDLSILAGDYGRTSWCRIASHPSDINGDCLVNISDLNILASRYGQ